MACRFNPAHARHTDIEQDDRRLKLAHAIQRLERRSAQPNDFTVRKLSYQAFEPLAQVLLDSVGPRLTASPGIEAAQDWAVKTLQGWGVEARTEQYGTWEGWERGVSHVDLISPRVRSLEGRILAWSPGTDGRPVEGEVAALPVIDSPGDWKDRWTVSGNEPPDDVKAHPSFGQ